MTPDELLDAIRGGDRRALARALSIVEDERPGADLLRAAGHAARRDRKVVGVTGAPGVGKSTLVDALVAELRGRGRTVGVVAVDPSSPLSGGALLGDRLRMQRHVDDPGVFVRSMANRGRLGGLAAGVVPVLGLLGLAGFDELVVETVGVGQAEVEVAEEADTTIVVVTPGWGDDVQTAKAGLLEVADVFVVNKADRPGAAETVAELRRMLELGTASSWAPPVVSTVAVDGTGIPELVDAVERHRRHLDDTGDGDRRRRRRAAAAIRRAVDRRLRRVLDGEDYSELVAAVAEGEIAPDDAARRLVDEGGR
ncbi:MAG TPA: methylmalonyl Co-A mutase-associated GTPase MeaB [Actinobacteria bacterium]|nr:methylmalonyl Co-A mutase-associated GTPase MeaB [Actinomycetota bacterium]